MIHCPYCDAPMDDAAKACPRCRSLMVADQKFGGARHFPTWLHPAASLAVILVISIGLIALGWDSGGDEKDDAVRERRVVKDRPVRSGADRPPVPEEERENKERRTARLTRTRLDPESGTTAPGESRRRGRGEFRERGPVIRKQDNYEKLIEYENSITPILAAIGQLSGGMDEIFSGNDKSKVAEFSERMRKMQFETQKMRGIKPPPILSRVHNQLANSLGIQRRGYRHLLLYLQEGEVDKLDLARKDHETARRKRAQALADLAGFKQRLKPPPEPEPPPAPEPAVGDSGALPETAAETRRARRSRRLRGPIKEAPEIAPEVVDADSAEEYDPFLEGDEVEIEDGDTGYYEGEEGDEILDEEYDEVLEEGAAEEDIYLPEGEVYPEDDLDAPLDDFPY